MLKHFDEIVVIVRWF